MRVFVIAVSFLYPWVSISQQLADSTFRIEISDPRFPIGNGPSIYVDAAHANFHTIDGRYAAFARVLEADGYKVHSFVSKLSKSSLNEVKNLVISNALHPSNAGNWDTPPLLPAFDTEEISSLYEWVINGGNLLLIADHQPFPGAASSLAMAFGVDFNNGFAMLANGVDRNPEQIHIFSKMSGGLKNHSITEGIDSIRSFTGQAFRISQEFTPIMEFDEKFKLFQPDIPWEFDESTRVTDINGWCQGAVAEIGEGKVAVFGEGAMFTAQIQRNKFVMGLAAPGAEQNLQFLRNLMKWLTGENN